MFPLLFCYLPAKERYVCFNEVAVMLQQYYKRAVRGATGKRKLPYYTPGFLILFAEREEQDKSGYRECYPYQWRIPVSPSLLNG